MLNFLDLVHTALWIYQMLTPALKCANKKNLERYRAIFGDTPEFQAKVMESVLAKIKEVNGTNIPVNIPELKAGESCEKTISLLNPSPLQITLSHITLKPLKLASYSLHLYICIIIIITYCHLNN